MMGSADCWVVPLTVTTNSFTVASGTKEVGEPQPTRVRVRRVIHDNAAMGRRLLVKKARHRIGAATAPANFRNAPELVEEVVVGDREIVSVDAPVPPAIIGD
jgi:hypothetical protein